MPLFYFVRHCFFRKQYQAADKILHKKICGEVYCPLFYSGGYQFIVLYTYDRGKRQAGGGKDWPLLHRDFVFPRHDTVNAKLFPALVSNLPFYCVASLLSDPEM
jgi:hypothetical protein